MKAKISIIIMLLAAMLACGAPDMSARKTRTKRGERSVRTLVVTSPSDSDSKKGDSKKKIRKTFGCGDDLAQIVNYTSYDIIYTEGDRCEVVMEGPQEALSRINAGVSNRTLSFRPTQGNNGNHYYDNVTIRVTAPAVGTFNIYGSGDLIAQSLEAVSIKLQCFGSGDIIAENTECTSLSISSYGSGDITVRKALCTTGRVLTQGSGDIGVNSIQCSTVDVIVQGSGDVKISGIESSTVQALCQGSGDIILSGETVAAYLTCQGSGDITATRLKAVRTTKTEQGSGEITD